MVRKGMTGATGNIYLGLHDFSEMGFLLHFLEEDDLFGDIGANIGSYSILASGVNGAKTIAFEPSLSTFNQLRKNIEANKLENRITTYNVALGANEGKLCFTTGLDTVNHVLPDSEVEKNNNCTEIRVTTLDNVLPESQVPLLVKIDVEGFETEVIKGMEKTLQKKALKGIIIELNGSGMRYGYDENLIHEKLLSTGFEPYEYNPYKRKFHLIKGYGNTNTLYLRDINFIEQRVSKGRAIKIFNDSF
jgi:FkbM family methyltransferase